MHGRPLMQARPSLQRGEGYLQRREYFSGRNHPRLRASKSELRAGPDEGGGEAACVRVCGRLRP
jgi:hypothetical protein